MPRIGGVSSAGHRSWTGTTRLVPMAGGSPHLAGLAHELIIHVGAGGEWRPSQTHQASRELVISDNVPRRLSSRSGRAREIVPG